MKHILTLLTALLLAPLAALHAAPAPAPCGLAGEPVTLLTYRDAEWYGSTFWTGPDWTRVGKDWHHPGQNTPSVRRFTAPRDGRVTVTGRVFKLHLSGDGIRASIRHNDREIWKAEIDGDDDKGVEPKLALDVKKGDALRFVVDKRGGIGCDTTGWDPVVTYSDGQRFQASVSFVAKKQGEGGWFYEMLGKGEVPQPDKPPVPAPAELKEELARLAPSLATKTDLDLLLLALEEWWREDKLTDAAQAYKAAIKEHAERTQKLAAELGDRLKSELQRAAANAPAVGVQASACSDLAKLRSLYVQTRLLKREIILSNPLLNFDKLLLCKRVPPSWSHLVAQYFGWRQRPGGGLFVLEKPGRSLAVRDIVGSQLPAGNFLEPRLSYDGRRIVFSYVTCPPQPLAPQEMPVNEQGDERAYFHIYEINVDGSGLRQLTRGRYDDMMPCYLPDGGIAFVSTRRRSYSRCFGPEYSNRWHSYTLHRMNADGSDLRILSLNDVSEWFPAVSNTGEILFARWDYIDRDAVTHQNLWSMRPDGTNPIAIWGNATPKPHCTFQAKAIPGSQKIVFVASAHHAITGGPVCVLDPAVDPNSQDAITRLTPGPYPEAESGKIDEYYESPWPLSEKYFLVAYSPERLRFQGEHPRNPNPDNALGLYVLDAAGNREMLYRDPKISSTSPMPLRPQPMPPALPSTLTAEASPTGEMLVTDIYQGLGDVPRGAIKELRIVQIFPKTTYVANSPRIGVAGEENTRAILGTVPVEADGSARFIVPAHKPVLFQALDKDGFAYQTMRSTTYVQPGEKTSCVGCHEHRMSAPTKTRAVPLAMQRSPSRIEPGELGGRPFAFVEVVQPVLNKHCVKCHAGPEAKKGIVLTGEPRGGFTKSYVSLCGEPPKPKQPKPAVSEPLVPRYAQRNQIQMTPVGGVHGALGSRLMKMLRAGHNGVKLSDADLRRLAAWIDCNAVFYGSFDPAEQSQQLAGQPLAMPEIQ
jgi:cytochrome c553